MKVSDYIQPPNFLLSTALLFAVLAYFMPDGYRIEAIFSAICYGVLFAWAWQEIRSGTNWFRRLLGLVVFILLVAGVSVRFHD